MRARSTQRTRLNSTIRREPYLIVAPFSPNRISKYLTANVNSRYLCFCRHIQASQLAHMAILKLGVTVTDHGVYCGQQKATACLAATSAIAHYNAGVEHEYLQQNKAAVTNY